MSDQRPASAVGASLPALDPRDVLLRNERDAANHWFKEANDEHNRNEKLLDALLALQTQMEQSLEANHAATMLEEMIDRWAAEIGQLRER